MVEGGARLRRARGLGRRVPVSTKEESVMAEFGPIATAASAFIEKARSREYPADVLDLARMCVADWYGVALGARGEQAGESVRKVVTAWNAPGRARVLFGGTAPAAMAALVNGTYAHCLDFDDVHFPSLAHLSAPTWAAVLALGTESGADHCTMLSAFVTGFEIGARLGSGGVGEAVNSRGWHSTGVVGRLSAAAAASVMLGLDSRQAAHALGIAATQTSGLVASFGTDSKPLHAGRAAFDGVFSAQLARAGFRGATDLLDREDGLARAVIQDGSASMHLDGLGERWELRRNALKPYACCGFTHAPVDAGRKLHPQLVASGVSRAVIHVHPLAPKVAGQAPVSPLAAKFSIAYCTALALHGFRASAGDFSSERLTDQSLQKLARKVEIVTHPEFAYAAAILDVVTADGRNLHADIPVSLGNPGNPMSWGDLEDKFLSLTEPVLATRARPLFDALRGFGSEGETGDLATLAG